MEKLPWLSILLGNSLSVGYGSGDEVRLFQGHLQGTRVLIGVGSNRVKVATALLAKHGMLGSHDILSSIKDLHFCENYNALYSLSGLDMPKLAPDFQCEAQTGILNHKVGSTEHRSGMGIVLLDDGMQHWRVNRDIEIVMVNALSPFGNGRLLPHGPLREPLEALCRADIVVIHHANLVSSAKLNALKERLKLFVPTSAAIFCSRMVPCSLSHIQRLTSSCIGRRLRQGPNLSAPLSLIRNAHVLCISGVGCPESLTLTLEQLGALFVDRIDFPDHHHFEVEDLVVIKRKLHELKEKKYNPVIITTEKDYARDPDFFWRIEDFDVYILCSMLEVMNGPSALKEFSSLVALKLRCWKS